MAAFTRDALRIGTQALVRAAQPAAARRARTGTGTGTGNWTKRLAIGTAMRGRRPARQLAATPQSMVAAWPPLLVIHGRADLVVSPKNGGAAARLWANAAGAQAGPARSVRNGKRHLMWITDFKADGRLVARLAEVERLAHAWSAGSGKGPDSDPLGPDASRMVWSFAAQQFSA